MSESKGILELISAMNSNMSSFPNGFPQTLQTQCFAEKPFVSKLDDSND